MSSAPYYLIGFTLLQGKYERYLFDYETTLSGVVSIDHFSPLGSDYFEIRRLDGNKGFQAELCRGVCVVCFVLSFAIIKSLESPLNLLFLQCLFLYIIDSYV